MMCGVITQIIHSIDHIESRHSTDSVKNINVTFRRTARVWLNIAENAEQIYMTWESRPTSSFTVEVGHEALLMLKSVLNIAALRIAGTSMKRLGSALIKRNDIIILFYFVQRKENKALPRIDWLTAVYKCCL